VNIQIVDFVISHHHMLSIFILNFTDDTINPKQL